MELACLDGTLVPLEQAVIPVTDEGLLRGDGAFEVIRLYGGRPYALDEHLERLERSLHGLRLEVDVADVAADVRTLLRAAEPGDGQLRIVLTRGGRRIALIEPLHESPPSVSLGVVEYVPTRVLDGIKSLSYAANMLAGRLANERGFDEALLVTPHGRVLEAPTSSLFAVVGGRLRTPDLGEHMLDSITRRKVLAATAAEEAPLTLDELRGASGAFLASTTREVQPVSRVEDVELDPDDPLVREAAERTAELIAAEVAALSAP